MGVWISLMVRNEISLFMNVKSSMSLFGPGLLALGAVLDSHVPLPNMQEVVGDHEHTLIPSIKSPTTTTRFCTRLVLYESPF